MIDRLGESLDVAWLNARHHRDTDLVATQFAVAAGIENAVGPKHRNDGVGADLVV